MVASSDQIKAVPTNIVTGFLGVGKTTTILHLLKSKPADQRWAVLVNEFGQVGVDGSLIQGQHNEEEGVYIREVPGGCMCCTAGLSMQVALNQLLIQSRPDRLLIEPTGLGHPKEVLRILLSSRYREVLDVQQILALVNARHLSDQRYTNNDTYNQQIAIADIIVGNKSDLYLSGDKQKLQSYVNQLGKIGTSVLFTSNGRLDSIYLNNKIGSAVALAQDDGTVQEEAVHHEHESNGSFLSVTDKPLPAGGCEKITNQRDGYCSVGWRFSTDLVFNRNKLFSFLSGIEAERMKAVFVTDSGSYGYNMASGLLTEMKLTDCAESHIEIISSTTPDDWDDQLKLCMNP